MYVKINSVDYDHHFNSLLKSSTFQIVVVKCKKWLPVLPCTEAVLGHNFNLRQTSA